MDDSERQTWEAIRAELQAPPSTASRIAAVREAGAILRARLHFTARRLEAAAQRARQAAAERAQAEAEHPSNPDSGS